MPSGKAWVNDQRRRASAGSGSETEVDQMTSHPSFPFLETPTLDDETRRRESKQVHRGLPKPSRPSLPRSPPRHPVSSLLRTSRPPAPLGHYIKCHALCRGEPIWTRFSTAAKSKICLPEIETDFG